MQSGMLQLYCWVINHSVFRESKLHFESTFCSRQMQANRLRVEIFRRRCRRDMLRRDMKLPGTQVVWSSQKKPGNPGDGDKRSEVKVYLESSKQRKLLVSAKMPPRSRLYTIHHILYTLYTIYPYQKLQRSQSWHTRKGVITTITLHVLDLILALFSCKVFTASPLAVSEVAPGCYEPHTHLSYDHKI